MEDEVDEITSGVLAEIGIEVRDALPAAPRGPTKTKAAVRQTTGDKATDALLAELGIWVWAQSCVVKYDEIRKYRHAVYVLAGRNETDWVDN